MRAIALGFLGALLLHPQSVCARKAVDVELSGTAAVVAAAANEDFYNKANVVGVNARAQITGYWGRDFTGFARVEAVSDQNLGGNTPRSMLREAWLRYLAAAFDVTLGRQLFPAGRTDIIVLQDQFAPRDLAQLSYADHEQRLGLPALRVDAYPADGFTASGALIYQDQGFILPEAIERELPSQERLSDAPVLAGFAKIQYRGNAMELGIGATTGRSPLPAISVASGSPETRHPRNDRLFLEGTYSAARGVMRWDVSRSRPDAAGFPGLPGERWSASLGWDQGLWADSLLSVQGIYIRSSTWNRPDAASPDAVHIAQVNRALFQAFETDQHWITATLRQRPRSNHELETVLIAGNAEQYGIVQRWIWKAADQIQVRARLQYLEGHERSLLGSIPASHQVYMELRYHL